MIKPIRKKLLRGPETGIPGPRLDFLARRDVFRVEVGVGFSKTMRQTLRLRTGSWPPQKNGRNFSGAQKHGFRGTDGAKKNGAKRLHAYTDVS